MKYFAYGSNMLERRLRSRVFSGAFDGVGALEDHRLRFNKRGRDGSGKCNVERSFGNTIYGVVFSVDAIDIPKLDEAEDVGRRGYSRESVEVHVEGETHGAACYVANPRFIDGSLRPFDWYLALVVAGAREHELPVSYCDALASNATIGDPDRNRREAALAILGDYRVDFEAGHLLTSGS